MWPYYNVPLQGYIRQVWLYLLDAQQKFFNPSISNSQRMPQLVNIEYQLLFAILQ